MIGWSKPLILVRHDPRCCMVVTHFVSLVLVQHCKGLTWQASSLLVTPDYRSCCVLLIYPHLQTPHIMLNKQDTVKILRLQISMCLCCVELFYTLEKKLMIVIEYFALYFALEHKDMSMDKERNV